MSDDPAVLLLGACSSSWTAEDADGDGFTSVEGDCWDNGPGPAGSGIAGADIHPGAFETWYDGVDADCEGNDDFDQDGDGFVPDGESGRPTVGVAASGGLPEGDCWDDPGEAPKAPLNGFDPIEAADVNPSVADVWYDGLDQDCDGADDFDQDGDGFTSAWFDGADGTPGDDCFDAPDDDFVNNAGLAPGSVFPGAAEIWYDGTDQDCDGNEFDQDGDGYVRDAECNDEDPKVFPSGEPEVWYNCADENCDANDGDADGDGYVTDDAAYAASCDWQAMNPGKETGDCWDNPSATPPDMVALAGFAQPTAALTHPTASDAYYDAVDQDCGGQNDSIRTRTARPRSTTRTDSARSGSTASTRRRTSSSSDSRTAAASITRGEHGRRGDLVRRHRSGLRRQRVRPGCGRPRLGRVRRARLRRR